MNRRDFIKTVGAVRRGARSSDLIGDLLAQSPPGRVLESKFKGLADIALAEASCAAVRTPTSASRARTTPPGVNATGGNRGAGGRGGVAAAAAVAVAAVAAAAGGGGRGGGRPAATRIPTDADGAAGFGVRVIHSGVWGFASSPIVTEDEIRRITRLATRSRAGQRHREEGRRQARAGPGVHGLLANADDEGSRRRCPQADKQALVQAVVDKAIRHKDVAARQRVGALQPNGSTSRRREGSYIEQELFTTTPSFSVTARRAAT